MPSDHRLILQRSIETKRFSVTQPGTIRGLERLVKRPSGAFNGHIEGLILHLSLLRSNSHLRQLAPY